MDPPHLRPEAPGCALIEAAHSPPPIAGRNSILLDYIAGIVTSSRPRSRSMEATRPRAQGIHHLKFAVSNLDVSIAWYERVLGARRVPALDHVGADGTRFAAVCEMPDWHGLYLELRHSPAYALKGRGWDPVTLSVKGREDLVAWVDWLDRWGTTHSPLLIGVRGWLLIFEDPDRRRIRMYTRENHGTLEVPSTNEYWLTEP